MLTKNTNRVTGSLAMKSVHEIIRKLGGSTAVAAAIGTTQQNVTNMKARGSIPAEYWQVLVSAARQRGVDEVTFELLAKIAHRRRAERAA